MKRTSLLIFMIALGLPVAVTAQECLPDQIIFSNQIQIDSFTANYPGCTQIMGDVLIKESENATITNLDGLAQLESIGGFLTIEDNSALVSLGGLNGLSSVGGINAFIDLTIDNNDALTDLNGLNNLSAIGGDLIVANNDSLTSLNGLDSLSYCWELAILNNNALMNLDGLGSLVSPRLHIEVRSNDALTSLKGLEKLTSIGGGLKVLFNDAMTSLSGVEGVLEIGITTGGNYGDLWIQGNENLTSLSGIENIDYTSINTLRINSSPNLSVCELENICNYLAVPPNTAIVSGNASGCNTRSEVLEACGTVSVRNFDTSKIKFYPNPTSGIINTTDILQGTVKVFDHHGRVATEKEINNSHIDISHLPSGVYLIQVQLKDQLILEKIIKQ